MNKKIAFSLGDLGLTAFLYYFIRRRIGVWGRQNQWECICQRSELDLLESDKMRWISASSGGKIQIKVYMLKRRRARLATLHYGVECYWGGEGAAGPRRNRSGLSGDAQTACISGIHRAPGASVLNRPGCAAAHIDSPLWGQRSSSPSACRAGCPGKTRRPRRQRKGPTFVPGLFHCFCWYTIRSS